jgi:O-antigen ligase
VSTFIIVALLSTVLAWYLAGAKSMAYMMYFVAFIPFLTLDAEPGGLTGLSGLGSSNGMFKLSIRLLSTAGMMLILVRRREATKAILSNRSLPVIGFFLWACLGIPQSQMPFVSLARLGELLVFFLFGITLFLEDDRFSCPRKVARWHCLALLPLLLMAMWSVVNRPELAFHVNNMGQGRLGHKMLNANVLAFGAVILTLWSSHELREEHGGKKVFARERVLPFLVLILALSVMVMSRSRTALVTLIAGQLVLWIPVDRGSPRRRLIGMGLVVGVFALTVFQMEELIAWVLRDGSSADLMSGTGRTSLWAALISEQVPKSPILGAGYLMLTDQGAFNHHGTWWTNTHNTYMFSLVSTGLPGFIFLMGIAILPFRASFRRYLRANKEDRSSWTLILACQTVVLISGVTGFGICGFPNAVMLFHYAMYTYSLSAHLPVQRRQVLRPVPRPIAVGATV